MWANGSVFCHLSNGPCTPRAPFRFSRSVGIVSSPLAYLLICDQSPVGLSILHRLSFAKHGAITVPSKCYAKHGAVVVLSICSAVHSLGAELCLMCAFVHFGALNNRPVVRLVSRGRGTGVFDVSKGFDTLFSRSRSCISLSACKAWCYVLAVAAQAL